ncbi:hypothetical protein MNBD_ALPHA05-1759, partial [hydrothermal vent metagenome]
LEKAAGAPIRRLSGATGAGVKPLLGELMILANKMRKAAVAPAQGEEPAWSP